MPRLWVLAASALVGICGCTATRSLSVSPSNKSTSISEGRRQWLQSSKTNTVTICLLTPEYKTYLHDFHPPAILVLVKNGGSQAIILSLKNVAVLSGDNPVRIISKEEYSREINQFEDRKLHKIRDTAMWDEAPQDVPAQWVMGEGGTVRYVASERGPITQANYDAIEGQTQHQEREVERKRHRLLGEARTILEEQSVPPGERGGGLIILNPGDIAGSQPLKIVVTLGDETHEFLFDVSG